MDPKRKSVGRPASVSTDDLYKSLAKFEIFDSNRDLKKASDKVWDDVLNCDYLKGKNLQKQNLYLSVKKTRKGLLESLKDNFFNNGLERIPKNQVSEKLKAVAEVKNDDSIKILQSMMRSVDYNAIIKEVSGRPMHVIYCLPDQMQAWRDLTNLLTLKEEPLVLVYSHKYVQNLITFNHQRDDITVFSLITNLNTDVIPIYQVISEKKHKEFMDYAIREFLRFDDISNPNDIILPSCLSIIEAFVKALNSISLARYMKKVFDCKDDFKKAINLPITCIHTDIMPILRFVEALEKTEDEKEFYAQFFCHLSLISDLKTFKSEVQKLLVFANSQSRNNYVDSTQSELQQAFQNDLSIRKLFQEYKIYKQINDNNDPFIDDSMTNNCSIGEFYGFIKEIECNAKVLCTPYKKYCISNPYRININDGDQYIEKLMNFLTFFPLWTKVNFSEDTTVDCFMQYRKSTEYFEAFDKFALEKS